MTHGYDRGADDVGNIVKLEHVNLTMPDQRLATLFYITGLGFTRDPYLVTGVDNMWVNVGDAQFHLPTGAPQVFRGTIGLVVPDLPALVARLARVGDRLAGTRFRFAARGDDCVDVVCPWGNRLRVHGPDADRFGARTLGMPYLEFDVPPGTTGAIGAFYREVVAAPATAADGVAVVNAGPRQELRFVETASPPPAYDGHHVQVYFADFSGPHRRLLDRGLITEESDAHQYRFVHIVDPRNNAPLFAIEHEVRSLRHPLCGRTFVNRNPAQTNQSYVPGRDAL